MVGIPIWYPKAKELAMDELTKPLDELISLMKGDQPTVDDVWPTSGCPGLGTGNNF
jgi:hypothetical protein